MVQASAANPAGFLGHPRLSTSRVAACGVLGSQAEIKASQGLPGGRWHTKTQPATPSPSIGPAQGSASHG